MENRKVHPIVLLGVFIAVGMIVSVAIVGVTLFKIRSLANTVSVTGSAKMEVVADQGKWVTQFSRTVRQSALKSGYDQVFRDLVVVREFIVNQGFDTTSIVVSPVTMFEVYQQDQYAEKMYTLTQTVEVQSGDVDLLARAAGAVTDVVNKGVLFSTTSLEYYYSKLPEARIELLSKAIEDASTRAGELAKNSNKRVGDLVSASSGVVQVQSRNSTDVSDYGSYDTSKKDKQITVTVKASFRLR